MNIKTRYEARRRRQYVTRSSYGPQFCRGALERGLPTHRCTDYTTVHYPDGRRYHFCDEHPCEDAAIGCSE